MSDVTNEPVEKLVRDGKVGVLVSAGYGAGWSTWADDSLREFMVFDRQLVEAVEAGNVAAAIARVEQERGDRYFYDGGAEDLTVAWVAVGRQFLVHEYDGYESLKYLDETSYLTA